MFGYPPHVGVCAGEPPSGPLDHGRRGGGSAEKLRSWRNRGGKNAGYRRHFLALSALRRIHVYAGKPVKIAGTPPVVALARDNVLLYYEDGLAELRRQGAELVEFSPPEDTAPLLGPAGFTWGIPGADARRLSENIAMRKAVRKAVLGGCPVWLSAADSSICIRAWRAATGELPYGQ